MKETLNIEFEKFEIYKEWIKKNSPKKNKYREFSIINEKATSNNINIILKKSLFKYLLIITLIAITSQKRQIQRNLYLGTNSISLKIKSTGNIRFYNNNYSPFPNQIKINGTIVYITSNTYYFNTINNEMELIWDNNLETTKSMFDNCGYINEINLSNFDTSKVKDMSHMFHFCSSLTSIDLTNFDTSNVENMDYMLYYCSSLTSLDLSYFDTSNVLTMNAMFGLCSSLLDLNLSNFNNPNTLNMGSLFYSCSK